MAAGEIRHALDAGDGGHGGPSTGCEDNLAGRHACASALDLEELPQSLLVIGGGYIGAELAQMFARAGVANKGLQTHARRTFPTASSRRCCWFTAPSNSLIHPTREDMSMAKVILGNHTAVRAARSERDRIRKFYSDVLGCIVKVRNDDVDRFQLDDVHFCFLWQDTALGESEFSRATWLELKTDNAEEMRHKILAFGVKKLDVPDPHLYFQAPGGQVFRLVGIDEDLSAYEDSGW
jgi:hypothetical protein